MIKEINRFCWATIFLTILSCLTIPQAAAHRQLDRDAQIAQAGDERLQPGYAWVHPACMRYITEHPNILILGDSIFDGWSGYLIHVFPKAIIDASVGRQFSTGVLDYQNLLRYSGIRAIRVLVVELGTNGPITWPQAQSFLQLAGMRTIYIITPSVPRPWQKEVLQMDRRMAAADPHVILVHWHRAAEDHPKWFWSDRVHPNWLGIQELVNLLRESVSDPSR